MGLAKKTKATTHMMMREIAFVCLKHKSSTVENAYNEVIGSLKMIS
jgi:hypothetical protein